MADKLWTKVRSDAELAIKSEPLLSILIQSAILNHSSLQESLISQIAEKLCSTKVPYKIIYEVANEAFCVDPRILKSVQADLLAVFDRDPSCNSVVQPILYFKGFVAIQAYRVSHWLWNNNRYDFAYLIQSRSSEVFGIDIHPAAKIGNGLMIDHAHSIVIGETATVGNDVSMLHSVTLGGTGSRGLQRHPTIEDGVLLGAGAKVLGNITVGHCSKVASGSVVLKSVPPKKTVAGVPAKIVGEAGCTQPSITMDQLIGNN
jgi:serine O-acetyltransferase|tara:strand:- start:930 stop:1709 length:780 start_codon:yes stop_codon:yes gene_type:complete